MNKDIGDQQGRYQQSQGHDLSDQYRAIGIPAINAATLCNGRKERAEKKAKEQVPAQYLEFED